MYKTPDFYIQLLRPFHHDAIVWFMPMRKYSDWYKHFLSEKQRRIASRCQDLHTIASVALHFADPIRICHYADYFVEHGVVFHNRDEIISWLTSTPDTKQRKKYNVWLGKQKYVRYYETQKKYCKTSCEVKSCAFREKCVSFRTRSTRIALEETEDYTS